MDKRLLKYLVVAVVLCFSIMGYSKSFTGTTTLEMIKQKGELVIATRDSATTYYEGANGSPAGFEYDLAKKFADDLGVKLRVVVTPNISDSLAVLEEGEAHFSAAGVVVTEARKRNFRFGPSYQEITQQVVYRSGNTKPDKIEDLYNHQIELAANGSAAERMEKLQEDHPELKWDENPELNSEQLLTLTWQKEVEYTIANSNELTIYQRFYPELKAAFKLDLPLPVAWAFPKTKDSSLYDASVAFFAKIRSNGDLASLVERYYGHTRNVGIDRSSDFYALVYKRLPKYRNYFERAGASTDIDWRLLAAVGYQESEWDPSAVSPTGVRGIMMITREVARDLGISKRTSPQQSILGGAKYIKQMKQQLAKVAEPDRTWLALAAYNVGIGHLSDARQLTKRKGNDPDKWMHVKLTLPLVRSKYANYRGNNAVRYVDNVRNYYDVLVHMSNMKRRSQQLALTNLLTRPG